MNNLQLEKEFFHFIAGAVRNLVSNPNKNMAAQHKKEGDIFTQVDIDVENFIVSEIKKRFPQDRILAEENHADTVIQKGRIWIIDPICGTNNFSRGIKNFCTNIALVDNNQLIASCVIDHSQNDYLWSIGNGEIYVNTNLFQLSEKRFNTLIEVDFGSVVSVDKKQQEKHNRFLKKMITETNYYLISLNSSLGFAYVAIRKMDGFINIYNHPWDICASSFLIQQAGGVITDLTGKPWTLASVGAIAAKNKDIHKKLLETFLNS